METIFPHVVGEYPAAAINKEYGNVKVAVAVRCGAAGYVDKVVATIWKYNSALQSWILLMG